MDALNTVLNNVMQIAFSALGILAILDYLRFRNQVRRDIALIFASLTITIILQAINNTFSNGDNPLLTTLASLVLIIQPYFMVRLVGYFRHVPDLIRQGAVVGMLLSSLIVVGSYNGLSSALAMPIVLYFCVINGYAMLAFSRGAISTSGITHQRLNFTATGSGLFALVLFIIGIGNAVPSASATADFWVSVLAIGSAFTFYVGLAPPRWLQKIWQRKEMEKFLAHLLGDRNLNRSTEIWYLLCRSALEATGGSTAMIIERSSIDESCIVYWFEKSETDCSFETDDLLDQYWQKGEATAVPVATLSVATRACLQPAKASLMYFVPLEDNTRALLVFLQHGSLFVSDDLNILQLFVNQVTIVLDNISLIEELSQRGTILEEQVLQRTAELSKRNTYINLLQSVTVAANDIVSIQGAFQSAIDIICNAMDIPIGHVFLPADDSTGALTSSPIWYLENPQVYSVFREATEKTQFSPQLDGIGQVVATGEPLWLRQISENSSLQRARAASAVGLQTAIFIPVLRGKETVAALEFFSNKDMPSDKDLIDLMVNVGIQLGRIIERKQAQLRVRASETRFRSLFEAAPTGIIIIDGHGTIVMVNDKLLTMFGYKESELVDRQLEILLPERFHTIHSQHRTNYIKTPTTRAMGVGLDLIGQRKDGTEFPIEVGLSYFQTNEGPLAVGFISNIGKRKELENELRSINQELEQRVEERTAHLAAVNKELEAFSYSVSHDLRAPLRAVDGFSLAILEDFGDILNDEGKEYLNLIRTESQRMGQLIDDLIDLSRYTRTEIKRKHIDFSDMVNTIVANLQKQYPSRQVEFIIEPELVGFGDSDLIYIVLQNLLENAWKYTSKKPQSKIEFGSIADNGQTLYFVRDNGVGFNMAYAHKLFGAFQRLHTKSDFEGTGIGLATVQRIIHRHGGTIKAEGVVDEGATFFFTLGTGEDS